MQGIQPVCLPGTGITNRTPCLAISSFFPLNFIYYFNYMHMYVSVCGYNHTYTWVSECGCVHVNLSGFRRDESLWSWSHGQLWAAQCGSWKPDSGPLKERCMLLTSEPAPNCTHSAPLYVQLYCRLRLSPFYPLTEQWCRCQHETQGQMHLYFRPRSSTFFWDLNI